ncbi:MAG: biopolymer transporter ExbD [Chlamydiota bacterium]
MRRSSLLNDDDSASQEQSVNLTPLIDVVFVVLIMFILIAPLVQFDRIQLASGKKEAPPPMQPADAVKIYVYADNSIQVNGQSVDAANLLAHLKKKRQQFPQKTTVQLFHDKAACFGTYQYIKNKVEIAGFEAMDIILDPN